MVIKFDLSTIPTNVDIKNAVLSFYFSEGTTGDSLSFAYRLTREWSELGVTWMSADSGVSWDSVGGDYSLEHGAQTPYVTFPSWESYSVTEIVKQFTAGTPNYGFIIIPDLSEGNTGRDYIATESSSADSLKPKLTITYESNAISTGRHTRLKGIKIHTTGTSIEIILPVNQQHRIELFSARGTLLTTTSNNQNGRITLPTGNLSAGIYFLKVKSGIKNATCKIVITQ